MKAIYLVKNGSADQAFELRESSIPAVGPNEVLIKAKCFGLNFADVVARRGMYPDAPEKPCVLGYDVAGHVEQVGKEVKSLKPGDRVAALCKFGGYAEYVTVIEEGVCKISEHISFAEATALATQGSTAMYCMSESLRLHKDELVLVHAGAGGVGNLMCQIAVHHGCKVIATASKSKHNYLKSLGVETSIDYHTEDFKNVIESKYGKRKVDHIFDSIGGKTFAKGMQLLKAGGKIITYGVASQMKGNKTGLLRSIPVLFGFGMLWPIKLLMHSQAVIGVNMLRIAEHKPKVLNKVFREVVDLTEKSALKIKVAEEFSYKEINKAHDFLESGKSIGKVVVNWD